MEYIEKWSDKFAWVRKPWVWAVIAVLIVLGVAIGTASYWKPALSGLSKGSNLANTAASGLPQSYENAALGISFSYPDEWTMPVESELNGVILLESPDKSLAVEMIKGTCYKASEQVLCMNGYQITLGLPEDENVPANLALLQSIVDSIEFGE